MIEAGWKGQGLFSLLSGVVWTSLVLALKCSEDAKHSYVTFAKLQGRTEHAKSCGFEHQGTKVSCFNFLLGSLEFMVVQLDFVQGFAVDDLRYALEQLRYVKYGKASAL